MAKATFMSPRKMDNFKRRKVWTVLTQRLVDTLHYFWNHHKDNGYYPSYREAARHFDVTSTAIEHRIWSLEHLRFIERPFKKARAIKFLKDKSEWIVASDEQILNLQRETAIKFLRKSNS